MLLTSEASLAIAVIGAVIATIVVLVGAIFPFRHDIFRCLGRGYKGTHIYELAEF